MHVTFLGTGSAMPLPDRVQTGLLLEPSSGGDGHDQDSETDENDDRRPLLVDCGSGVLHRLSQTDVGYEGVASVLLTHHHLDHVSDLLALLKARWLAGEDHLEVVGPTGTKSLLDDLLSIHDYLQDRVELSVREVTANEPFEVAGYAVEAYETRHSMPCLAYRFGDAFTFSGDSEAFEGLANFADGSAVLAHDCSFPDEIDVSNHPTPTQLGEALSGCDVDRLYLTHLYPHTEGKHREMLDSVEAHFDGEVRLARDGLRFETPE
ncbi:ribonuclease Z [Haloprofundus marisrubri]|uniref:Ribonuclease Z n=1 Tax=Haloprofundus marisrubri TaxID=1514971 RepID=A0A0W1R6J9_9EURY|nr:MBL fold metallo-hydrolase [Haloprofundus marisrubri]KTG08722.1 ribonuclease Z [Haloprofundus marisrubri]